MWNKKKKKKEKENSDEWEKGKYFVNKTRNEEIEKSRSHHIRLDVTINS